jgi:hypothetical protein
MGLICPSGPPGQGCETNCPSADRSSGSWVFPAPSLAFCRCRPGLRGLPGTRAAHRPEPVCGSPRELDLPSKALENGGDRLAPTPPLVGFVEGTLSPTCLPRVHSREPKPPSARRVPPIGSSSVLVVPPHLDGFLRAEVAGLLHPAAGQGFVAFHAHRGLLPEAVRRRSGARDPHSGAPRDAVHTLRSLLFADSRTASLRPLPPCRYRPAEAGRRSDSVMLRSAEADPHVTEHEVPSRRRSDAGQPRTTPDGRSRTGARRGPGDQTRPGWVHPERSPSTRERTSEDAVSRAAATGAAERGEGLHRVHRSGRDAGPSNHRGAVRLRGLAPSTKFVVVRPPLPMTDARSFHGLCSPSRFLVQPVRSGGAWPATSEAEASKGGPATSDAQARRKRRISGIPLRVHPRRRAGARRRDGTGEAEAWPRTGAFSARRSWPPCRDPAGEPAEAGFAARPVPGESVRSTSREGLVCDALDAGFVTEVTEPQGEPRRASSPTSMGFSTSKIAPRSNPLGRTRPDLRSPLRHLDTNGARAACLLRGHRSAV